MGLPVHSVVPFRHPIRRILLAHLSEYRNQVLGPVQSALGRIDTEMIANVPSAFSANGQESLSLCSGLHEVLNAQYAIWMDSVLHERIGIDGPTLDALFPRPTFLRSWLSPTHQGIKECLTSYMALYITHFARPSLNELQTWCNHPSREETFLRDLTASAGLMSLLQYRCECDDSPASFFQSHE